MAGKSNETEKSSTSESTEELLNISNVVAESLRKLNEVNRDQYVGIETLVENLAHDMVDIVEMANDILRDDKSKKKDMKPVAEKLSEISEKAKSSIESVNTNLHSIEGDQELGDCGDSTSDIRKAAERALSNAFDNAVLAQQQANLIMQAAATQGIAAIYSISSAALSSVEAKRIKDD